MAFGQHARQHVGQMRPARQPRIGRAVAAAENGLAAARVAPYEGVGLADLRGLGHLVPEVRIGHEPDREPGELFADSVRAVLDAEKVDRAFFFGHSMGFAVTEVIAAKYPERCLGLAAIDGAHFEVSADPDGPEKFLQENAAFAAAMTNEAARESFIQMLFLADTPVTLQEEILQASRTVPLSIAQAMIAGVGTDWKYFLPRTVDLPCLAIYSPAYQLPPTYRDDFARIFPRVEYHEVPNVSHFYMLEIPEKLNQLIADFIARH